MVVLEGAIYLMIAKCKKFLTKKKKSVLQILNACSSKY
jgi:hypothetical protein